MNVPSPPQPFLALPLRLLVLVFLFLAASDPFRFFSYLGSGLSGDSLKTFTWAAVYLPFAILAGLSFGYIAWPWGQNRWLLAVYILILGSVFWGASLSGGLVAAAAPLGAALTVSYLAVTYTPRQMIEACAQALLLCALVSCGAALLVPGYALMEGRHDGLWRGITGQKNNLAQIMLIGVVLCYLASRTAHGVRRRFYQVGMILCLFVLFMAGSATAWLVGVVTLLCLGFFLALRQSQDHGRYMLILLGSFMTVGLILLLSGFSQTLFELLGRDATLTDRIPLWQGVWTAISDRAWLGFGYGQFWDEAHGTAISYVRAFLLWDSPHAHNGMLELALNLGLIGVAMFTISFLITCRRVALVVADRHNELGLFAGLALVLMIFFNITEAALVTGANILWVLYLYCALRLPLEARLKNSG